MDPFAVENLIALLQHLILKLFPALTVETTKHVWVTINRRVAQIAKPIQIHKKILKIAAEDQITTLYSPDELQSWEDYNSFPSYMKSSHQNIMNLLCVMKECSRGSSSMLGKIFNMDGILKLVQTRVTKLLKDPNPLGFISREFSKIKEFILISVVFGLTPSIAAFINRIPLYLGWLWSKNKHTVEAIYAVNNYIKIVITFINLTCNIEPKYTSVGIILLFD